jgi:hypothetical protein
LPGWGLGMAKFGVCGLCGSRDQVLDLEHYIGQRFKKYFPANELRRTSESDESAGDA